jgi:CRP-like cAMP-binding protein
MIRVYKIGGVFMINHDLYNSISDEEQVKIVESLKQIELKKGDFLFWENEKADYVYFVKSGNLKVFKTSFNGNETIFDIYDPDSFIALGVLFNEPKAYPASCSAVNDAVIYGIGVEVIENAIVANPLSAKKWIAYMNKRLTTVQKKLSDQVFSDSIERLRKIIKYFQSKYPSRHDGKYLRVSIPITKQEMSELMNVRRETLSRILSSLKDQHLCEITYKELIVDKEWLNQD